VIDREAREGAELPARARRFAVANDSEERTPFMPSKLFVHIDAENHFFGPTDFVELCRLPLEAGRPYLVQATGLAGLQGGVSMTLRLDVCGFFGQVISSRESRYINDNQQFLLTAAAKLPAEGGGGSAGSRIPPGASANLLVRTTWTAHQPGHSVSIADIVVTALEVDEIAIA
jgi:hypothetical protein